MINLNFIMSYNRPRIETDLHSILINPPNYIIYFYITILYNYIIYYTPFIAHQYIHSVLESRLQIFI